MARRFYLVSLVSALLMSAFVLATPAPAQTVMQCMAECVKSEGNDAAAKSTCKSRCANVAIPQLNSGNQPDCMTTYKACNRSCAKADKSCQRACKGSLMSCK
ncbi:MAG: hypothetical protein HQ483_06345 [Rhodospirillales bacterium]|nr:hypothetical protein [Rhodospirillales bacterium]